MAGLAQFASKFNAANERLFAAMGTKIAQKPVVYLAVTVVMSLILASGFAVTYVEEDIFKLWIEKDSRLHKESAFQKKKFPEVRALIMQSTLGGADIATEDGLKQLMKTTEAVTSLEVDVGGKTYGWEDLCARPNTPYVTKPLLNMGLSKDQDAVPGFPCNKVVPIDCWSEGEYDFSLKPLDTLIPGFDLETMGIPNSYATKPSLEDTTDEMVKEEIGKGCTIWAGTEFPEKISWGGVTPSPAERKKDPSLNIEKVEANQALFQLKNPEQLAYAMKMKDCRLEKYKDCAPSNWDCADSCVTAATACFPACTLVHEVIPCAQECMVTHPTQGLCTGGEGYTQADCETDGGAWTSCTDDAAMCSNLETTCMRYYVEGNATALSACTSDQKLCAGDIVSAAGSCKKNEGSCISYLLLGIGQNSDCRAGSLECGGTDQPEGPAPTSCWGSAVGCGTGCLFAGAACDTTAEAECDESEGAPTTKEIEDAEKIILAYEEAFLKLMEEKNADSKAKVQFKYDYYSTGRSTSDLVERASSASFGTVIAGYVCMFVFAALSLARGNALLSRTAVGFVGVLLVICAVLGSFGLISYFGIAFDPTTIQVLPFLALGLGVDDMFVLAFSFKYDKNKSISELLQDTLKEAGASISLTSICNLIAFVIGSFIPLPSVANFSAAAAICVTVNFFVLLFGFSAVLAIDAQRTRNGKMDCVCCKKAKQDPNTLPEPSENALEGSNKVVTGCLKAFEQIPVRIGIIVINIVILVVAVLGASEVDLGLPLSDIVPESTYASGFLTNIEKYFDVQSCSVIVGFNGGKEELVNYDNPQTVADILTTMNNMRELPGAEVGFTWLDSIIWFANRQAPAFLDGGLDVLDTMNFVYPTNDPDDELPGEMKMIKQGVLSFVFEQWITSPDGRDGAAYAGNLAKDFSVQPGAVTGTTSLGFYAHDFETTTAMLDFIKDSRGVLDAAPVSMFASGLMYSLWEQFMNVNSYMITQLIVVIIGIMFASFFFLFHPGVVLIMTVVITLTIVEVYGFLVYFGLKINSVCVLNLVMGVGVSVEFTAHICRVFMLSAGRTKVERAKDSIAVMIGPIVCGGASTFLGVFFMAFADFPYFRLYFFNMYVLILLMGFINGVLLLPTLLSFMGPASLTVNISIIAPSPGQDTKNQYDQMQTPKKEPMTTGEEPPPVNIVTSPQPPEDASAKPGATVEEQSVQPSV